MKHYKSVEFLSIFRMSSHPALTQSPPHRKEIKNKTCLALFLAEYKKYVLLSY